MWGEDHVLLRVFQGHFYDYYCDVVFIDNCIGFVAIKPNVILLFSNNTSPDLRVPHPHGTVTGCFLMISDLFGKPLNVVSSPKTNNVSNYRQNVTVAV